MAAGEVAYQGGEEIDEGRGGHWQATLISHRWYDVGKLAGPGSSNLNLSFLRI